MQHNKSQGKLALSGLQIQEESALSFQGHWTLLILIASSFDHPQVASHSINSSSLTATTTHT